MLQPPEAPSRIYKRVIFKEKTLVESVEAIALERHAIDDRARAECIILRVDQNSSIAACDRGMKTSKLNWS